MRERAAQPRRTRLPRGSGAERQDPRRHRDDGERHDPGTERRLVDARHLTRIDDVREGEQSAAHNQGSAHARHPESRRLDHGLSQELSASRAQGRPHGHLDAARLGPHEQQDGDVRPRDEKHERGAGQQEHEGGPNVTDDGVGQRRHHDRHPRVVLRIRRAQPSVDDRQVGPRLADGDARREPPHDVELRGPRVVQGRVGVACEHRNQRKPDVGVDRVGHVGLQDPDNRERGVPGKPEAPADECRVAAHTQPETMADDGDELGALDVVGGLEEAPVGRPRADHVQELGRGQHPVGRDRLVIDQDGGRRAVGIVDGRECVEADRLVLPHQILGIRDRKQESAAAFDVILPYPNQPGIAVADRLQNHRVGHREQRRHRREAEAQRGDRHGRGERSPNEAANREAEILPARHEGRGEPRVANVVPGRLEPPEAYQRLPSRLGQRDALRPAGLRRERDVMPQLLLQLAVGTTSVEEHPQPDPPCAQPSLKKHDPPPSVRGTSGKACDSPGPVRHAALIQPCRSNLGRAGWRGSVADQQHVVRHLPQALAGGPPVQRSEVEDLQHQWIQGSLHPSSTIKHGRVRPLQQLSERALPGRGARRY